MVDLSTAVFRAETRIWSARSGDFEAWERRGVLVAPGGILQLDPHAVLDEGSIHPEQQGDDKLYSVTNYFYGEAVSPPVETGFSFRELVGSWNASTPDGTWIEMLVCARSGGAWTRNYSLGVWASGTGTVRRHSVESRSAGAEGVATDVLVLLSDGDAYRLTLRLCSTASVSPEVTLVAACCATEPSPPQMLGSGNKSLWGTLLDVPQCSQMVYPDGGNVWCSPTSLAMLAGYWNLSSEPCEGRVRAAVRGVYDYVYDGHGNWPFNAAYTAGLGLKSYVTRFTDIVEAEPWIAAGIPLVLSLAWEKGQLTNSTVDSTDGHLIVLCGFDSEGNPIVNDPAAPSDTGVRRTYRRDELSRLWLEHSGGTVYVAYPPGHNVPLVG